MLSTCSAASKLVSKDEFRMQSSQMSFSKILCLSLILVFPLTICGMSTSYPAVALPQMKLERNHASYFGSVLQFASPFGAIMVGGIIDQYGRRSALLFSIIPSIIGWFILYLDSNITATIAGQLLNGLMAGAVGYPSQVYAGECIMANDISLRNSFLSWIAVSNAFGMFLVYVLGYFLPYHEVAIVASALSLISFTLTYFCIPESPPWLHLKGRTGDAEWAEKKLGLCNPLLENVHPHHSNVACENLELSPFHSLSLKKLKRKDVWKPLVLGSVLSILLSLSGGMPLLTYMIQMIGSVPKSSIGNEITSAVVGTASWTGDSVGVSIDPGHVNNTSVGNIKWITNSTNVNSSPAPINITKIETTDQAIDDDHEKTIPSASNLTNMTTITSLRNIKKKKIHLQDVPSYGLSIISGAIILIANVLMSLLLPHFGIKKILIYPLLGMALGMFIEALTLNYKSDPVTFLIHVGAIWLVTFNYSFSLLIVPDSMLGDLFPVDAKGYASIPYMFEGLVTAVMCKAHPHLYDGVGGTLFFFYSGICLVSAVFVSLFIPEIVGKTLRQINESFL